MIVSERILVLALLAFVGAGCGDRDERAQDAEPAEPTANAVQDESEPTSNGSAVDPIEPLEQQEIDAEVALDSDADGVPDEFDRCETTPVGLAVDVDGCRLRLKAARRFPEAEMIVEGHTDSVGSVQANETLAQMRADTVTEAFVDGFRVERSRIAARGFGAANPVADNATADGRAANRRVAVVVTPG